MLIIPLLALALGTFTLGWFGSLSPRQSSRFRPPSIRQYRETRRADAMAREVQAHYTRRYARRKMPKGYGIDPMTLEMKWLRPSKGNPMAYMSVNRRRRRRKNPEGLPEGTRAGRGWGVLGWAVAAGVAYMILNPRSITTVPGPVSAQAAGPDVYGALVTNEIDPSMMIASDVYGSPAAWSTAGDVDATATSPYGAWGAWGV